MIFILVCPFTFKSQMHNLLQTMLFNRKTMIISIYLFYSYIAWIPNFSFLFTKFPKLLFQHSTVFFWKYKLKSIFQLTILHFVYDSKSCIWVWLSQLWFRHYCFTISFIFVPDWCLNYPHILAWFADIDGNWSIVYYVPFNT